MNLQKNRTNTDWPKYKLMTIKENNVLIHELKLEDTMVRLVRFINTSGICAVTGDFGNWIFCREFHPSKDGYVCDNYWCEKAQLYTEQSPYEFDPVETEKELSEAIKDDDISEETKDYLDMCINSVYEKIDYMYYAYSSKPDNMDAEEVIYCEKIKPRLLVVFDAFEEICRRLK